MRNTTWIAILAAGVLALAAWGWFFGGPPSRPSEPPAPPVWVLRDGTVVTLRFEEVDPADDFRRETVKILELAKPGAPPQSYRFGQWHGGYATAELRTNEVESLLWLVDPHRDGVGCSLNRATGEFLIEFDHHRKNVARNGGRVVPPRVP